MSDLKAPLFPHRDWVDDRARRLAEDTPLEGTAARVRRDSSGEVLWRACGTIQALEHWVTGGTFHQYGVRVFDQLVEELGTAEPAVERMHEVRSRLHFEGKLRDGGLRWMVSYQRSGDHDANGFSSGPSTAEDVAYSALTMIEQHEREVYERQVVGLA